VRVQALVRTGLASARIEFASLLAATGLLLGCHVLATVPGWSMSVLITGILGVIGLEWGPLRADKSRAEAAGTCSFIACALLGVLLRALDIKLHATDPTGLVWLGHSAWHFLISAAVLVAYHRGGLGRLRRLPHLKTEDGGSV
jgi:hypothetical protein